MPGLDDCILAFPERSEEVLAGLEVGLVGVGGGWLGTRRQQMWRGYGREGGESFLSVARSAVRGRARGLPGPQCNASSSARISSRTHGS